MKRVARIVLSEDDTHAVIKALYFAQCKHNADGNKDSARNASRLREIFRAVRFEQSLGI